MTTTLMRVLLFTAAFTSAARAQTADTAQLRAALQAHVDSFRLGSRVPGLSVAVALPDGRVIAVASGMSDTARGVTMTPALRLPQGSVGKTYYAAVAMQLVAEGRLDLDALASRYLGGRAWWRRIPNADSIRVRHLMNHTSGVMRYEFSEAFTRDLTAQPYRRWTPEELLAYIFDAQPRFAAGNGWEYSDTNYFLLGLIIESLTRRPLQDEVQRRFLGPLRLTNTVANSSPVIPGVAQGYAGANNPFGGSDAVIGADGRMIIDPAFEWAGGGYSSTAADLARWAHLLYGGTAIGAAGVERMVSGAVAAPQVGGRYGYGIIIADSIRGIPELGGSRGHSGFFPGYVTEMRWFTTPRVAVVVMANTSAQGAFARGRGPARLASEAGQLVAAALAPGR